MLAHMIGHEAAGSILSLLKRRGWANSLSAGPSETCTGFSVFGVSDALMPLIIMSLTRVDASDDLLAHSGTCLLLPLATSRVPQVDMELTVEGLKHTNEITTIVYQYIALVSL